MPGLKAMPGRVILRFPKPAEKSSGGLILPQNSQLRPEFGEIVSIGEPTDDKEARAAHLLRELQGLGVKIAVTFAAGTSFWRDEFTQAGLDKGEWAWLKDLKAYRLSEVAAYLEE